MALPSFIDIVSVTVGKQVNSSYVNGASPFLSDTVLKYVLHDTAAPDAGYAVCGQAAIGVQLSSKERIGGDTWFGSNAFKIIYQGDTTFVFNANATGDTQINPEQQGQELSIPVLPAFSNSVFWV